VYYARSEKGTTPLHIAVKNNCHSVVKYFIEEWGNIDVNESKNEPYENVTPLSIAIAKGYLDMAHFLKIKGAKFTPEMFYLSCSHTDQKVMHFVIEGLKS
jgi:ankyrin repeat protein